MSLQSLAAFAVANNNAKAASRAVQYWTLSAEELRDYAKIKDGNKKPAEDGSQALVIFLGKVRVNLDVVAPKATRINASADQVEQFVGILETAVAEGSFDEALLEAADKLNPANKVANAKASGEEQQAPSVDDLEGLDEL